MPITKSVKKSLRSAGKKAVFNARRKRVMKARVKAVRDLVGAKNTADAVKNLPAAYKGIDKAVKRGVIKKNTAARKKSRLAKLISKQK